jgi:antitoxin FitA
MIMAQLIVRNLDDAIYEQLKQRAATQHRSLEAEVRLILENAARERVVDMASARTRADAIRTSLEGRAHSDSASLIREDRDR